MENNKEACDERRGAGRSAARSGRGGWRRRPAPPAASAAASFAWSPPAVPHSCLGFFYVEGGLFVPLILLPPPLPAPRIRLL